MIIEIQKRKCMRCGNEFNHTLGGIVFVPNPSCPKCGFIFTRKVKTLF